MSSKEAADDANNTPTKGNEETAETTGDDAPSIKASEFRELAEHIGNVCSDGYDVLRTLKHALAHPALAGNRFPNIPTPTGGVERLSDVSPLHPEDVRKFLDDGLIKLAFLAHAAKSRAALVVDDDDGADPGPMRPRRLR